MNKYINIFSLSFDPLSILFIFVILLISIPSIIFSFDYLKGEYSKKKKIICHLLVVSFIISMCLVVSLNNAFAFLIMWEIMSLISYFLVIFDDKDSKSIKAGTIYIVMTHFGTAFIIIALLILHKYSNSFEFSALKQAAILMPAFVKDITFLCFLIGFGTKAGIVPLHLWLPYAHPQAPSHVSSIMSGVMIKTAIYGIIRFIIFILGINELWWGYLVLFIAILSCLVGVMYALMEHDLKKLLAYHSVENIGIILLGIGASMVFIKLDLYNLSVLAMIAGLYHLINHAIFKSLLFLCSGSVYKATGTRDIEKLGGLIKTMPWTTASFLVGSMAISALPPFNGFISEWLTLQVLFSGTITGNTNVSIIMGICAAGLALTGGLAAACFVKAFGITFLAVPRSQSAKEAKEAPSSMVSVTMFLAALTFLFGICASPIVNILSKIALSVIEPFPGTFNYTFNHFVINPLPGTYLSVPLVAAGLALIGLVTSIVLYLLLGKRKTTIARTWDCGYYQLSPRNEYTSTAFSKPFRIAFSFFYQPTRKTEEIKETHYYVKSMKYETAITPIFKKYIYKNIMKNVFNTANFVRKLQTGSIHIYIAYIFAVTMFLIVFIGRF